MAVLGGILYLLIVCIYLLKVTRGRWFLNPAPLFVLSQTVMYLGSVPLLDMGRQEDVVHLFVMSAGLCFFVFGALLTDVLLPISAAEAKQWYAKPFIYVESGFAFDLFVTLIIVISISIGAAYFYAVGYVFFWDALRAILMGSPFDAGTAAKLRMGATGGDQYFAPGYVNQFKNTLLPLCVFYLGSRYVLLRKWKDWLAFICLAPISLILLVGNGQRGPLVIAVLIGLVLFNVVIPTEEAWKISLWLIGGLLGIFSLSSLALGRNVHTIEGISDMGALFGEFLGRIFQDNQLGSVVGFRYVLSLPTQQGSEWVARILDLLPGPGGSKIDNEIHALIFGGSHGTSPLSLWGSIWYNFNLFGAFVPFLLGMLYPAVFVRCIRGPKTLFRLLTYAAISVLLGVWIASGPDFLVNIGLVAIVLLKGLVAIWIEWNKKVFGVKRLNYASLAPLRMTHSTTKGIIIWKKH